MPKNRVLKKRIGFTTQHKDPFLISKCPIEYSVLVQPTYEFSKWLADNMSFKPGSADYGYWITGFKGQKSLQENSDDLVSMTTSTEAMDMAMTPAATTQATASVATTPSTAQGIRSLSVYAGNAFAAFEINGVKIGAKGGGEKFDISLRENESIYYMQYGINRWDTDYEWINAICSLKIGTNFQEYGPYHEARVLKLNAIVKKLQF